FQFTKQQDLAKTQRKLFQGALQHLLLGAIEEDAFRGSGRCRNLLSIFFVQLHRGTCLQAGTRGQERVAQNAVNPGAKIRTRLERREALQRLDVSLLHQVLGFAAVLREPVGKVEKLVE